MHTPPPDNSPTIADQGRPPTCLTVDDHAAFNDRFSIVAKGRRTLIVDNVDGRVISFTRFAKEFGRRGQLWLASDYKRFFPTVADYYAFRATLTATIETQVNGKNSYRRRR